MVNSQGKQKSFKTGFYWCGLTFPFLTGKATFLMFLKSYFIWKNNPRKIALYLISQGYTVRAVEGGDHDLAEVKVGIDLPKCEEKK